MSGLPHTVWTVPVAFPRRRANFRYVSYLKNDSLRKEFLTAAFLKNPHAYILENKETIKSG